MRSTFTILLTSFVALKILCAASVFAQEAVVFTSPKEARAEDKSFAVQGEYTGLIGDEEIKVGVQVVALGNEKFRAVAFPGGLPGDGWSGEVAPAIESKMKDDGSVEFESENGLGICKDDEIAIVVGGQEIGFLEKVKRKSKTLGMKPPEGAIVLFDGTNAHAWDNAVMNGVNLAFDPKGNGATTKQKFGSFKMHIEFRLPYMPEARGQQRGNSGLYLQSRYEVQMLDSFGLSGENNECGGIYTVAKPKLNMCYPPLRWQTYDVDFTAAEYDDQGSVAKQPHVTVRHNGILIHKDVELPNSTRAAPLEPGADDAPIYLQNHGNPVRYRNIWVQSAGS